MQPTSTGLLFLAVILAADGTVTARAAAFNRQMARSY
ncbi:msr9762 (plasmid) [Mesorhizobium japonicum MAFF 303099]|uniref:Msr9762 protein n=1 Tax=Mesorhizobium japonicum (strain LMG 29417 / CECT 9101 / MAFF 303099) TaxID=266835 RepID=Q98P61_RHILO|nr:msr9762 [Mesorhizobium japonicum MAFF 303099]